MSFLQSKCLKAKNPILLNIPVELLSFYKPNLPKERKNERSNDERKNERSKFLKSKLKRILEKLGWIKFLIKFVHMRFKYSKTKFELFLSENLGTD